MAWTPPWGSCILLHGAFPFQDKGREPEWEGTSPFSHRRESQGTSKWAGPVSCTHCAVTSPMRFLSHAPLGPAYISKT